MEGDLCKKLTEEAEEAEFLSTPSGWRATQFPEYEDLALLEFLSTPSGWRATLLRLNMRSDNRISIHALRVEGDCCQKC